MDDRYVTYREHSELKQEVMTLRAKLEALPDEVRELRRDIAALKDLVKQPNGSSSDNIILGIHHLAEKLQRSGGSPIERLFAWAGAICVGGLGVYILGLAK